MLVSRRKRYLSGSDWVINTLDHTMKETTCSGNMSQIVLMLDAPLDGDVIKAGLDRFAGQFPVLQGRVARDWKLTPYWKIPAAAAGKIFFTAAAMDGTISPETVLPLLERSANGCFRDERDHLAFHLITGGDRSALAMSFDHRLMDARGAESFLHLFQKSFSGDPLPVLQTFTSSMELTRWREKFLAGRNVNRRIIALAQQTPCSLPLAPGPDKGFRFRLLAFDKAETAAIYDRAYREAGYLMESPFFLAAITRTMHKLFANRFGSGSCYLIPVTTDIRAGKDSLEETFFNHVSYLFYQVPAVQADDMKGLIASFKEQMYDQVKSGFPKDLAAGSLLTRIAPLGLLGKLLYMPLKGRMATFAYSHLGKSAFQSDCFM